MDTLQGLMDPYAAFDREVGPDRLRQLIPAVYASVLHAMMGARYK